MTARAGRNARSRLAWAIAGAQIIALTQGVVFFAWHGVWSGPEIAIPGLMAFAAVGALIASRRVRNRLGWLLLLTPVPVTMNVLVIEYANVATLNHVPLPLVSLALWFVNWGWTPLVGSFPVILVRFPEGRVARRWRFVDWLAATGTVSLGAGLAVSAGSVGNNVFASAPVRSLAGGLMVTGLALLAVGMVCAAISLAERYRHGDRKLRSQLKWILLAAIVVTLASVYMAVVEVAFRVPFGDAMLPSTVVLVLIPVAIGVAVLHDRLFDIDVIISRTLVYVILTAVLGGLYIAVIELVQRLFVLYTGETSDMAIVITAFIVAAAFTPIQKSVDRAVERRFGGRDAVASAERISSSVESVVRVIEPDRVARWLVDELVDIFEAEGGTLYLHQHDRSRPFHTRGHIEGQAAVEIAIHQADVDLGRLLLGRRRGGIEYSRREVDAVKRAAASLGEALVVATELGHIAASRHASTQLRLPEPAFDGHR